MLRRSSTIHQPDLFGTDFLMQLDSSDPLLKLAAAYFCQISEATAPGYSALPAREVKKRAKAKRALKRPRGPLNNCHFEQGDKSILLIRKDSSLCSE